MAQNSSFNRRNEMRNNHFICGVVEGFYGRPWTLDQRKHLYGRSSQLGFNTYLYAPKDDIKHRASWRELYTEEEIVILRDLVDSAKNDGVNFVYAISPGLDIMYSNPDELETLKRKLEQVISTGCNSFALLFDDIEITMQDPDKKKFQSFAHAHVYITNEIFAHTKSSTFFFCPTEYCESRAYPNLEESEYLNTVGVNLHPDIHIMWTGPRVISRYLTEDHLKRVAKVLRRKSLIWDNLHANDYDQKRVFMGPLMGRPVEIKKYTSGLLSNPNCKYEANYIPFHSLSDWNAADKDIFQCDGTEPHSSNKENSTLLNIDCNSPTCYNPAISVKNAINSWIHEYSAPSGPNIPQIPKIDLTTQADFIADRQKSEPSASNSETPTIPLEEIIQTIVAPEIIDQTEEINSLTVDYAQPMEEDEPASSSEIDTTMSPVDEPVEPEPTTIPDIECSQITALVDVFYLPFESGYLVRKLFEDFSWILENASVMKKNCQEIETLDPMQSEWLARYDQVNEFLSKIIKVFGYIIDSSNKALVSELIPYAWEAHGASVVLLAMARWLVQGLSKDIIGNQERFWEYESIDEPWNVQGGFVPECIKLICPNEHVESIFTTKAVLPLSICMYEIRPYSMMDEEYAAELSLVNLTKNEDLLRLRAKLFCDRSFKPFLLAGAEYNFISEESSGNPKKPMCFASAHSNGLAVQEFLTQYKEQLRNTYSQELVIEGYDFSQIGKDVDHWFPRIQNDVFINYPAWVDSHFAMDSYDSVPMKKILQVISVTLATNGVFGMFTTVPVGDVDRQQYFLRLGFSNLGPSECTRYTILGHKLCPPPNVENVQ